MSLQRRWRNLLWNGSLRDPGLPKAEEIWGLRGHVFSDDDPRGYSVRILHVSPQYAHYEWLKVPDYPVQCPILDFIGLFKRLQ